MTVDACSNLLDCVPRLGSVRLIDGSTRQPISMLQLLLLLMQLLLLLLLLRADAALRRR